MVQSYNDTGIMLLAKPESVMEYLACF